MKGNEYGGGGSFDPQNLIHIVKGDHVIPGDLQREHQGPAGPLHRPPRAQRG